MIAEARGRDPADGRCAKFRCVWSFISIVFKILILCWLSGEVNFL